MIAAPVVITAISTVVGFAFRYMAEGRKERHSVHMQALKSAETYNSIANDAAKRGGVWVRRFLVASLVLGIILIPAMNAYFGVETSAVVVTDAKTWFGRLFHPDGIKQLVTTSSFIIDPELAKSFTVIIGFYFGQAAAK